MKKFIAVLCVVLLSLCLFVGCADDSQSSIDLEKYEIGDELPIYPNCEFDYKVNDECTVHISSIKLTLVEKREITENCVIENDFFKYTFNLIVTGVTHSDFSQKNIEITFNAFINSYSTSTKINNDGTFVANMILDTNSYINQLTFRKIKIL